MPPPAPERYELNWPGKRAAYQQAHSPSQMTLVPDTASSIAWTVASHALIAGDNLDALKLLQPAYHGRFRAIYIDPPYNTGSDTFIYADTFAESRRDYQQRTHATHANHTSHSSRAPDTLLANRRDNGHFHTNWLSMMLPRLILAHQLLHEDGLMFVSIDDHELANLRLLLDEVFGEENFRNLLLVRRYDKNINTQFMRDGLRTFNTGAEYVLVYSKSPETRLNPVFREASETRKASGYWKGFWNDAERPTMQYPLLGVDISSGQWKWKEDVAREAVDNYRIYERDFAAHLSLEEYWAKTGRNKRFIRRNPNGRGKNSGVEHWIAPNDKILRNTLWHDVFASRTPAGFDVPFSNPKNPELIKLLLQMTFGEEREGLVLDFFAGSGSTAHAVLDYNVEHSAALQFVCVQLPEVIDPAEPAYQIGHRLISEVTRQRIDDVLAAQAAAHDEPLASSAAAAALDTSQTQAVLPLHEEQANALSAVTAGASPSSTLQGCRCYELAKPLLDTPPARAITDVEHLVAQLELAAQAPQLSSAEDLRLVWELAQPHGITLTESVEQHELDEGTFYYLPRLQLVILLRGYTDSLAAAIKALAPQQLISLDSAFAGRDSAKISCARYCARHDIDFHFR